MKIAEWSVKHPVAVTMRIASLVLLGAVCLTKLSVDLLPKVTVPTVTVQTNWPNVAPQQMETQVTRPIEQAVSATPGLKLVTSSTTLGSSQVRVQLNYGVSVDQASIDVLQLVSSARRNLPTDPTLQIPVVRKYDPSTLPILIFGVSGIDNPVKLRALMDNEISPILESADGVAAATVSGGRPRAVIVDIDAKKLQAYGISLSDVEQRISAENLNLPAGIARQGETEYTIRADGYLRSIAELEKIPLKASNGQGVPLSAIAKVRDAFQEVRSETRLNGEPAVGVIITKQSDANTIDVARGVREKLARVQKLYPELKFRQAYDQSTFIENSIDDLKSTALIGGLLAVLVLLFFLRNFRSTIVVALSIPISIITSFILFYFGHFSLNTISLSALALSTGLIVDDAVVVLENIFRHIQRDKLSAPEAAVSGTDEIMSAVVSSTITVAIVFMPLFLIQGQAGQTFSQFAWIVIFSILISLLDAVTVVPMLASRLVKAREIEEEYDPSLTAGQKRGLTHRIFDRFGVWFASLDEGYRQLLQKSLRHRGLVIGVATIITASSFLLWPLIGTELMPQTDSGNINVSLKMPVGTAYTVTNAAMKQAEKILREDPDVETVFSIAGGNVTPRGVGGGSAYQGGATLQLKDNRKSPTDEVVSRLRKKLSGIPGTKITPTASDVVTQILTGGATNMEVDVFSQNLDELTATATQTMEGMKAVPGLQGVDLGVQEISPEIQWKVDREKALQLGVSYESLARSLNIATSGSLSTYFQDGGFQYPIYVQVQESQRKTLSELLQLPLSLSPTTNVPSGLVPQVQLGQIATPVYGLGPNEITRLNRQRYIAVTGNVQGTSQSEVMAGVSEAMKGVQLPAGAYWDFGQNQKRQGEEFAGMGLAVFLAIALIYMLLASQFESFVHPLVILCSVPLCGAGVMIGLFVSNRAFGLTAFIGVLMLIGIVVKNGILLVEYTNQLRGRGVPRDEAVLLAGPTRLRPILMTTCAAVLGMMPLALGLGRGSETEAPLATVVVGGLITSTLLTLLVVPCVYTLFDDIQRRFKKDSRDLAPSHFIEPTLSSIDTPAELVESASGKPGESH